jgi:hypothetical protein
MLTDWVQQAFCLPQPVAFLIVTVGGVALIELIHLARRRRKR